MKIRDKISVTAIPQVIGQNRIATVSERLQAIMAKRDVKQADLARSTGISKGAISNYVLGRYEPKNDIIGKLASALKCSAMWLWGYDVPMEKSSQPFDEEENPYALEINDILESLEPDMQKFIRDLVVDVANNPEKMKISHTKPQLSEGDMMILSLFRQIPVDQQQVFLEMGRVYANSLKKD